MKLLSCYIENFGKIKAQTFNFPSGLTSFLKINGEGKTTLAVFLKAMFYGLEGCRKNSKDFNDRQHFYPFAGGIFGGNVVFEYHGKTYKIERTFDEKSETKDSCRVYCNGGLYTKWHDPLGEQIWGLDKTSFERTIYLTAADIELAATDSINSKLNNVVVGGDDASNLTAAIAQLQTYAKRFKKNNGNDLLTTESQRVHALEAQIANTEIVKASLPQQYVALQNYDDRLTALREQLQNVQGQAAVVEQWRTYDTWCAEANQAEQTRVKLGEQYPQGLCTRDELVAIKQTATEYQILQAQQSITPKDKQHRLPTATVVQDLQSKLQDYVALEQEAATIPDWLVNGTATKPQSLRTYAWLAAIALVVLSAGVGLIFLQTLVGIIITVAGGIGLLAVAFGYLNRKVNLTAQVPNPAKRAWQIRRDQLVDQLRATLVRYGYTAEQGVVVAITNLVNDYQQSLTNADLSAKITACQKKLQKFCTHFALDTADYGAALAKIERDLNLYQQAQNDVIRLRAKAQQYAADHHLTKRPDQAVTAVATLNDELGTIMNERANLLQTLTEAESTVEKLDDLIQERDAARARQKEYQTTYLLLQKTIGYLQIAANNLQERYLRPIKDQFVQYANLLEKTIGEKLVMDSKFAIMYEHNGLNRSSQHLSAGQKSICALCFRLALIDNMFTDEKPFLILDDPFVHLDAEHLTKAKSLLHELARDKQIVYFTCHASRDLR